MQSFENTLTTCVLNQGQVMTFEIGDVESGDAGPAISSAFTINKMIHRDGWQSAIVSAFGEPLFRVVLPNGNLAAVREFLDASRARISRITRCEFTAQWPKECPDIVVMLYPASTKYMTHLPQLAAVIKNSIRVEDAG